jgi:hypothetical protein
VDAVANEIERRDELGSKGIGGGISIPYGVRALPARQGMMFPSNGSGLFCEPRVAGHAESRENTAIRGRARLCRSGTSRGY